MNKQKRIVICLISILCVFYLSNVAYAKTRVKKSEIAILGYHHIVPDQDKKRYYKNNMWVGALSSFEAQMKLLHDEGYHTATLDELYAWKQGKLELPDKTVVITIDDGFYSAVKFAQPVLKKYGFTAANFVIGSDIPKHHHAYLANRRQHSALSDMKDQSTIQFYAHSYNLHHKKNVNGDFDVNNKSKQQLLQDTQKEKKLVSVKYYAYPFGKYNPRMQEVLKKEGTKLAFGFNENRKAIRLDDAYGLPRFCVNGYTKLDVFRAMLQSKD